MTELNEYLLIEQSEALKAQIAALTAERDSLRAKVLWLENSIDVFTVANRELTFAFNLAGETCRKIEAERDELRAALEEIAAVKPQGLLARWLVERAQRALNKPTN